MRANWFFYLLHMFYLNFFLFFFGSINARNMEILFVSPYLSNVALSKDSDFFFFFVPSFFFSFSKAIGSRRNLDFSYNILTMREWVSFWPIALATCLLALCVDANYLLLLEGKAVVDLDDDLLWESFENYCKFTETSSYIRTSEFSFWIIIRQWYMRSK